MKYLITAAAISVFTLSGCGGSAGGSTSSNTANTNAKNTNSNGFTNVDANNLPPGLSASPITPGTNTAPGIPANSANVPKGATPTPGIPDPKTLGKPVKPGATPTPGIPSPEEIRRQMQQKGPSNVNTPGPPPSGESMMRGRKQPKPVNQKP